jgi:4'-phosphopantetheinyl transferase
MIYIFYTKLNLRYQNKENKVFSSDLEKKSGKKLLQFGLKKLGLLPDYDIITNEFGKPYFKNNHIYFNISHSEGIIICCMSYNEVGVDIQRYRTVNKNSIDLYWNLKDYINFDQNSHYSFIDVWSQKEAIAKLLGYGLSLPFKEIYIHKLRDKNFIADVNKRIVFLKKIQIDGNYSTWVASEKGINEIRKEKYTYDAAIYSIVS